MKKTVATIAIFALLFLTAFTFLSNSKNTSTVPKATSANKPAVVEYFACGDNCPGPAEDYTVMVYEGISDEAECKELGGTPLSYTGWGTYTVCVAE